MNGTLYLLLIVLACTLAILFTKRILMAKNREQAYGVLLKRVRSLRFYNMLEFLGANPEEYLRVIPTADINMQIHRCSRCSTLDTCYSALANPKKIVNMDFCPNYKSINENSKTIYHSRQG